MSSARRASCLLVALVCVLFLGAAPAAARDQPKDQVVVSGTVVVPRGMEVGEVVVLHGAVTIEGVADGDVIVLDGPVSVVGQVSGAVIAVDGHVALGADAQVGGDVIARGRIDVAQGAKVGGTIRERTAFTWRLPIDVVGRFATWLAVSFSTLLLGLLFVLLAPRALDAVAAVARTSPWPSIGWGVGAAVGVPVLSLLAMASLVALPLGVVVLLASALLAFAAYAVGGYAVGRALWGSPRNRAVAFLFGWLILRVVAVIPVVSGVTFALVALYGFGSIWVATWRARAAGGRHREGAVRLPEPIREEAGL